MKSEVEEIARGLVDERPLTIAKRIADALPDLNAVEVLTDNGEGGLVYPEWP